MPRRGLTQYAIHAEGIFGTPVLIVGLLECRVKEVHHRIVGTKGALTQRVNPTQMLRFLCVPLPEFVSDTMQQ